MAPDPRQHKKFGDADRRKVMWILFVAAFVGCILLLPRIWRTPYTDVAVPVMVGTFLLGLITTGIWLAVQRKRRDGLLKAVQAARPGVPVILALGTSATREDALRAGVGTNGFNQWSGTSSLALAVLPDVVEVWVRGDQWPRWGIRRAGAEIGVRTMHLGSTRGPQPRGVIGLLVSDGERSVHCVPYYRTISGRRHVAHVEQALRDLGLNPAFYLTGSTGPV
jgi:hypothetical protein